MIKNTIPHRSGLAAIAAVLALSSTPVFAQIALPADPVASAPAPASPMTPAAPPVAAQAPVAQVPVQTV